MERDKGIEPSPRPWQGRVLPLYESRENEFIFIACRPEPNKLSSAPCLSSIILSPLNSNVKMSPHEQGDSRVESKRVAASASHFPMRRWPLGVRQSRGAARPIASADQTSQSPLPARQRRGSGSRQPRPSQPPPLAPAHPSDHPASGPAPATPASMITISAKSSASRKASR